jgi:hypothetical protein
MDTRPWGHPSPFVALGHWPRRSEIPAANGVPKVEVGEFSARVRQNPPNLLGFQAAVGILRDIAWIRKVETSSAMH